MSDKKIIPVEPTVTVTLDGAGNPSVNHTGLHAVDAAALLVAAADTLVPGIEMPTSVDPNRVFFHIEIVQSGVLGANGQPTGAELQIKTSIKDPLEIADLLMDLATNHLRGGRQMVAQFVADVQKATAGPPQVLPPMSRSERRSRLN